MSLSISSVSFHISVPSTVKTLQFSGMLSTGMANGCVHFFE